MDLSNYRNMDTHLLLGLLNTELRNRCDSLDDLLEDHDLERDPLIGKMAEAGYEYRYEINQFR